MSLMCDDIHEFIQHRQSIGRAEATLEGYQISLKQFRRFCALKKIQHTRDITPGVISKFHDSLIGKDLAKGSIAGKLDALRLFLRWAHVHGKTLSDLSERVERPKLGVQLPPAPLSREEMAKLLNLLNPTNLVNMRDRAILELFYATGVRHKELLGLNVSDIDFKASTLFIRGKGKRDRIVPVNDDALKAVATYLQTGGLKKGTKSQPLFIIHERQDQHRITRDTIDNLFRKVNSRFHRRVHPHLIRHSVAIHLLQGGADLRYVQAFLGHESPNTTSVYLNFAKAEKRRSYDQAIECFWSG